MAAGDPSAAAGDCPTDPSSATLTPTRLREALAALSQAFDSGDTASSEAAVAAVSDVLNAAADADMVGDGDDAALPEQLLREVHAFLSCPSSNLMAVDALSLVLLKPVAKLGTLVSNCWDTANAIIKFFVSNCSPRDMLPILCEALNTPVELNGSMYYVLLLDELAKVLTLIQRRHIEQVKTALPVVLKVMHAVSEHDEDHDGNAVDIFNAALRIGNAIQEVCKTMANQKKEELCSILGLYALQNIALVSRRNHQHILSASSSVLGNTKFFTFCGFTYLGLLTGNDVTSATNKLHKEEDANLLECFSSAMDGASIAVAWTYMDDELSKYAGTELESALKEVQDSHMWKWQAIKIFRYVLSSINYPWIIKSHTIDLLLILVDENCDKETNNHIDFPSSSIQIFATLKVLFCSSLISVENVLRSTLSTFEEHSQAIESVMIAAPDALTRKKAFAALKKVISMVPSSERFDILQALIKNSPCPSLTAILLDVVKSEVLRERAQADQGCVESERLQDVGELTPWACHALELVELILRPPEGGPPCLPDHSEQVLSALNLLRLILMIDSRGSRSAQIFREETMRKVYSEWLTPLRAFVAGIHSEAEKDDSEDVKQMMCSLNPVQLVLDRCIELAEERTKGS